MRPKDRASRYLRAGAVAFGLLGPMLSLVPLGSMWLWQNGYLLHWAAFACVMTAIAYGLESRLLRRTPTAAPIEERQSGYGLTPNEEKAWREVRAIAEATSPAVLDSQRAALDAARRVVETVARTMRPGLSDPLLHFTLPEALALVEQVSRRMRGFVVESVPLGDRLTVAQVIRLYGWRGAIDVVQSAFEAWRLLRLANPLTAITHEMRERLSHKLYAWGRDHVAKRIAETFIEETGRAAIDLYSGRLHPNVATHVSAQAAADAAMLARQASEPIRVLVAGRAGAGKSTLVRALAAVADASFATASAASGLEATRLEASGLPSIVCIDTAGLAADRAGQKRIADAAAHADVVLWVASLEETERTLDRDAIAELRTRLARPDRRAPPFLLVATRMDRVLEGRRSADGGGPGALLTEPQVPAAVAALAEELGFAAGQAVPVCAEAAHGLRNVEALWQKLIEVTPDARRSQLVRILRDSEAGHGWRRIFSQARSGGRALAGRVFSRSRKS